MCSPESCISILSYRICFLLRCSFLLPATSIWKIFFFTPNFYPENTTACFHTHICFCTEAHVTRHDPPLLFDLSRDPSETTPLTPSTEPNYNSVIEVMMEVAKKHTEGIKATENQLTGTNLIWKPWLQPCCSSISQLCSCQLDQRTGIVGSKDGK